MKAPLGKLIKLILGDKDATEKLGEILSNKIKENGTVPSIQMKNGQEIEIFRIRDYEDNSEDES